MLNLLRLTDGSNYYWWTRAGFSDDYVVWFFVFSSFLFGSCLGSFLNVCIWRMPLGESIVTAPSHCPKCGTPIRWFDNIPVVSYPCAARPLPQLQSSDFTALRDRRGADRNPLRAAAFQGRRDAAAAVHAAALFHNDAALHHHDLDRLRTPADSGCDDIPGNPVRARRVGGVPVGVGSVEPFALRRIRADLRSGGGGGARSLRDRRGAPFPGARCSAGATSNSSRPPESCSVCREPVSRCWPGRCSDRSTAYSARSAAGGNSPASRFRSDRSSPSAASHGCSRAKSSCAGISVSFRILNRNCGAEGLHSSARVLYYPEQRPAMLRNRTKENEYGFHV